MTLQLRPRQGGIPYAPSRDITYIWGDACKSVAAKMEEHRFAALHDWLDQEGVTDDDLGEACGAFCRFLVTAHESADETFEVCLRRAGWFEVKAPAQVALMFYLGVAMAGMFFRGIRDVVVYGEDTRVEIKQLKWYARRAVLVFSMSPWQRFWYFRFRAVRRWWWRRRHIQEG